MDNNNTLSELVQAMSQIQMELQQMNKTLSALVGQTKAASAEPAARPSVGRPAYAPGRTSGGYSAGRPSARPAGGFKRSEGPSDSGEESKIPGSFRYAKKSGPGRPKAGKPPVKKGDGYPKRPR